LGWHVPEALRWAWRGIASRDASKIRRGGRASGLKRATPCHVCLSSDRTARAVPLVLIAYGDAQFGWHAQGHGDRVAIARWLRLPSDGDKPHRNEDRSACVWLPHFEACSRMDRAYSPRCVEDPRMAVEHPGGSAQHHAMFTPLQTGRLAPNRYY
jgi:hypothetical protein